MDENSKNSKMISFWDVLSEKNLSMADSQYVEIITSLEPEMAFGRYCIQEKIGSGGMGCVYRAYDPKYERLVALKLIISADKATPESMERFWREAKTTAVLEHPYIVRVYELGQEGGQPYFSMQLLEGKSLQDWVRKKIAKEKIVDIFLKICEAVHYAHQCGVIHRDLKPENIMIVDELPCIMDFGLAKVSFADKKISRTGMVMGTLQYMSPEQAQGLVTHIDERSDIYSLGCILYYLITGKPPFSEKGVYSFHFLYQVLKKKPQSVLEYRTDIPKKLEEICFKALEKQKEQRYQSVAQIIEHLKSL